MPHQIALSLSLHNWTKSLRGINSLIFAINHRKNGSAPFLYVLNSCKPIFGEEVGYARVVCAPVSALSLTAHRTALLWRRAAAAALTPPALTPLPASPPPRPHNSLRLLLAQPLFIYRGGERRASSGGAREGAVTWVQRRTHRHADPHTSMYVLA